MKRCPTQKWREARGHLTWQQYRDVFEARGRDILDWTTFTIVRNPWEWHVSWFTYVGGPDGGRKSGMHIEHEQFRGFTFQDYLHWLEDEDAPRGPQGYIDRQLSDWIVDENNQPVTALILRQERLESDLRRMREERSLPITIPSQRVNVSGRGDWRRNYDARGIDLIALRHKRDIALFGYTFEG